MDIDGMSFNFNQIKTNERKTTKRKIVAVCARDEWCVKERLLQFEERKKK